MEIKEDQRPKFKDQRGFSLIFCLCAFILLAPAQEKYNKQITGLLNEQIFRKDKQLKKWFVKEYQNYHPDEAVLEKLGPHLAGKSIVVVLGTWCSDSQREFP